MTIQFRGKKKGRSEWVKGSLISGHEGEKCEILRLEHREGEPANLRHIIVEEVDPETVGQFIGLRDMNHTDAFVGDIVRDRDGKLFTIYMAPGGFGICRNTKMRELDFQTFTPLGDLQSSSWFMKNAEIVGNIFDNPELAGGER